MNSKIRIIFTGTAIQISLFEKLENEITCTQVRKICSALKVGLISTEFIFSA